MFRPASSSRRRRQSGATLIEVLIGVVLVSILLIGMNGLWTAGARQLDDAVLRQQAIMRLNGEMERLSAAYIKSATISTAAPTDYATNPPPQSGSYLSSTGAAGGVRLIYAAAGTALHANAFTNDATVFQESVDGTLAADADSGAKINNVYRRIYYDDNGTVGTADDDRNLVWLDKDRRIVGQLSWELLSILDSSGIARPCYPSGTTTPCRLLTVYLDYPFRFSEAAPRGDMGPVETITLQTIVGARP
ncbi:MAG TPA: prepilin-type N-terminal cleavage/methylation domain-containing protein [Azospirillaceae bacterium]|nr:prepilin-type N-terminal cleavage/methylation domain-containing protein [Azospirillaceae bacterium]HRQ79539.1 prepilin-type N-terminal cleavage/methylation domain-containing protein [Azospirillaceae bacterium]